MIKKSLVAVIAALPVLGYAGHADEEKHLHIAFTNATKNIYFTPLVVAAHDSEARIFRAGTEAGLPLQKLAEGGATADVATAIGAGGGVVVENPAEGLLGPGASVSFTIETDMSHLSVAAMLLPTNDGFVGLDSWAIPARPGTYHAALNAYDAGTEANDELIVSDAGAPGQPGIPADPTGRAGRGGSGLPGDSPGVVHVHPGNLGDTDAEGGVSDLDSREHRWLNPVARITVEVHTGDAEEVGMFLSGAGEE